MKLWMLAAILIISGANVLTSCSNDDNASEVVQPAKEYFTLWNQCEALTALQDYVKAYAQQPATAEAYCNRDWDFPYKITHEDLCFKLFTAAGFEWGGDWTTRKDYQHFEWKE